MYLKLDLKFLKTNFGKKCWAGNKRKIKVKRQTKNYCSTDSGTFFCNTIVKILNIYGTQTNIKACVSKLIFLITATAKFPTLQNNL